MVDLPLIGNGDPDPDEIVSQLDDVIRELEVDIDLLGKKVDQASENVQDLVKEGRGQKKHKKQVLAAKANREDQKRRAYQMKLFMNTTIFKMATRIRSAYETREIMDEGAFQALKDVMNVEEIDELQDKIMDLSKDQKIDQKFLQDVNRDIEQMEEVLEPGMEQDSFVDTMEELETLPEEEIDEELEERVGTEIEPEEDFLGEV